MATGYVRVHSGDIVTGAVVEAAFFNDEYDLLRDAFNAVTGHDHNGSAGCGAPIALATATTGVLPIANGGTNAATAAAARTSLGLAIGTNVQAFNQNLTDISALTASANNFLVGSGSAWTSASASSSRTALGLGSAALLSSGAVFQVANNLSEGTAGTMRTNLGLVIGTNVQAWDADLDGLAGLSSTGMIARTGSGTSAVRTLTAPAAGFTITNGDGVSGNPTFVLANDLAALEAMSGTGIAVHTGTSTWTERTLTAPAAGITITNGSGVSGNPTLVLANDLSALEGLGSTGFAVRSASDTWVQRSIAVGSGVSVSNGDGVSGNPTLTLDTSVTDGLYRAQGLETVYVPATAMISRTTNGAASGTTESTTNKIMRKTLDFDASTQEFAQFTVAFPKSYNNGTVTAQFIWGATNTGNCVWGLQGVAISDDDIVDAAFGTAVEVTDGVTATTDVMISATTAAITIAGTPATSDIVWFQVERNAASGSDTLAVDALLIGIRLFFTTNAKNDA